MNDSNLTNHSLPCKYWELQGSNLENTMEIVTFAVLCPLGMIANFFIIILALKYTVRKNLHHLIINMAVADALTNALFLIRIMVIKRPWMTDYIYVVGIAGDILCKATKVLYYTYSVSVVTLFAITVERLKATKQTLQRSKTYTMKQRVAVISSCWLIPLIVNSPALYNANVTAKKECKDHDKHLHLIHRLILSALVTSCSCLIFLLSMLIIRRLSKLQANQVPLDVYPNHSRTRRIRSAVRMVLASLLLYLLCWAPQNIYWFLRYLDSLRIGVHFIDYSHCIDWGSLLLFIGYFLPSLNSALSPCIYIVFLADFKKAAKRVLWRATIGRCVHRNIGPPAVLGRDDSHGGRTDPNSESHF